MIKVYGIKTWDSVRKALRFFKDNEIEIEFFDLKKRITKFRSNRFMGRKRGYKFTI